MIKRVIFSVAAVAVIVIIFFILTYTESSDKFFKRGLKYFRQERYHEALPFFISAFNMDTKNTNAAVFLLRTYEALGMKEAARQMLDVIWETNPQDMTIAEELADFRYSLSEYLPAEELYRAILAKKPSEGVKRKLAEVMVWQKKYDEASRILGELMEKNSADFELAEFAADVFVWAGKHDAAVEVYKKLLLRNYHDEEIVLKLADVLRSAGRNDEAIQVYNEYLKKKETEYKQLEF